MALNLDSLQGQAETGESARAANAFLFQLWAEAPSRGVHDFSLEDRFPLKLPALFLGGPARRAGQGRAGPGWARAARGAADQLWRAAAAPPLARMWPGGGGWERGWWLPPGEGRESFPRLQSAAARPAPTRAARAPQALAGSASRPAPAPAPRCSPRRPRWRSGPGAGGPRRRRCCCCCSG